jgi:type II secretory pathway component PulK
VAFLKARSFPNPDTLDQESRAAQIEFNIYADKAEAIANALIGESDALGLPFAVRKLKDKDIAGKLKEAGVGAKSQYLKQVFSVSDEYFRVRIVVGVGESRAQIDAAVHTVRKPERTSEGAEVLEYTLN